MSTETHITQFLREIDEKYKQALSAVGELKDAIESFKDKALSMSPQLREALNMGEKLLGEVEQKTEASDSKTDGGSKTSNEKTSGDGKS